MAPFLGVPMAWIVRLVLTSSWAFSLMFLVHLGRGYWQELIDVP